MPPSRGILKHHARKATATRERRIANRGHARGDCDACKAAANGERMIGNTNRIITQDYCRNICITTNYPFINVRYTVFLLDNTRATMKRRIANRGHA